jgi:tetratricopeptide (TPR) repeat protein
MCFRALVLLGSSVLWGANDARLSLALRAQSDFDRVESAALPPLADSVACTQSQAALAAVALPKEVSLVHFRKGYCTLAGALVTGDSGEFTEAAGEFDKSLETWAPRPPAGVKDQPADPPPAVVRVLASLSRLKAGADRSAGDRERVVLAMALADWRCPATVMPASLCRQFLDAGRGWLGWIALDRGNLDEAARVLAGTAGWSDWVAGRAAAEQSRWGDAAAGYRAALDRWAAPRTELDTMAERLLPGPDLAAAYEDLGGAQTLAGDPAAAIASLEQAVKRNPANAHAVYLRARAQELAGHREQALADYSLASRTAFASSQDSAPGEAHLYRGILLYRRQEYNRAEDEFSSALNFEVPAPLRADAVAWRHLAAVAVGFCGSGPNLDRAMIAASPYFPRAEARAAIASCQASASK